MNVKTSSGWIGGNLGTPSQVKKAGNDDTKANGFMILVKVNGLKNKADSKDKKEEEKK